MGLSMTMILSLIYAILIYAYYFYIKWALAKKLFDLHAGRISPNFVWASLILANSLGLFAFWENGVAWTISNIVFQLSFASLQIWRVRTDLKRRPLFFFHLGFSILLIIKLII